jgi:hypothetical protein
MAPSEPPQDANASQSVCNVYTAAGCTLVTDILGNGQPIKNMGMGVE